MLWHWSHSRIQLITLCGFLPLTNYNKKQQKLQLRERPKAKILPPHYEPPPTSVDLHHCAEHQAKERLPLAEMTRIGVPTVGDPSGCEYHSLVLKRSIT